MATKSKRFRVGVEGATTDGRAIEREWLTQMAESYNPAVYGARINMEHIKGYTPDSPFRRYGDVLALTAEEIADGPLAGKMGLYAEISPTADLVAMTAAGQKVYTSMEINPKFAETNQAYLVGLAVTDDPASLGTEMLKFSASAKQNPLAARKQSPENLFSVAEATRIEFEDVNEPKPTLFSTIKALFAKKQGSDDARFNDVHQAVELLATEHQRTAGNVELLTVAAEKITELEGRVAQFGTQLDDLTGRLTAEDRNRTFRQRATGGSNAPVDQTNC